MIGHNSYGASQTVIRSNPETGFTLLANAFLQDPRLSYETKGLLAELLSRPDDWEIRAETIVKSGKAGRDKVWRMLREAEELGYAASRQARTERGKFQKLDYVVTDDPKLLIDRAAREIETLMEPLTENPSAVIPFPEKPGAVISRENVGKQRSETAHGKPVTGEPRTEKPFTAQPCTANPHHTKERYIQTTERTNHQREGNLGKVAAAVAATMASAVLPAAAAPHVEHVQPAGEVAGTNAATEMIVAKVAKWINPYQPDYKTARNWLTSTLTMFGEPAVRSAYADMETKMASGDIVGNPLKLFTAICRNRKSEPVRPAAPQRKKTKDEMTVDELRAHYERGGV